MQDKVQGRRLLIINADDFGLHKSINEAVETAHNEGILTSATLAVNGDGFDDAVAVAKRNLRLGVGVHLTLVGEKPVSDPSTIPSIVDGHGKLFDDYNSLIGRIISGRADMTHIAIECRAQIARFVNSGLVPTHIDSHQHLHLWPSVVQAIKPVLSEYGIERARGLTVPWFDYRRLDAYKIGFSLFVKWRDPARKAGLRSPDAFIGFLNSGMMETRYVLRSIERLGSGVTEMSFHPGKDNDLIRKRYSHLGEKHGWNCDWEREFAALTDPAVKRQIGACGIRLVNYRDL